MADVFQNAVDELDLESATKRGSQRNDLLPPRHEDSVGGEVGKRFSEGLRNRMERGRYDPSRAVFVHVPKPGNTTRPAALLTLTDRVVFDALVEGLRDRIDAALLGKDIVFWPRGVVTEKEWPKFEAAALANEKTHIALTDISGFYESVDHEVLRDALVDITGRREKIDALIEFLGRVMNSRKGLPQGLSASDPLATAYLAPIDWAIARESLDYYRHGDDVRFATRSRSEARRALYSFESEARKRGLLINSSKSIIMSRSSYSTSIERSERVASEAQKALLQARIDELKDKKKVEEIIERSGNEQLGWDFFYHGSLSFGELVERVKPLLSPSDTEVAAAVFHDAMKRQPGMDGGLTPEAFHQRVSRSLVRLAAAKSPEAVANSGTLLRRYPEKTDLVANYLSAMPASEGKRVVDKVITSLNEPRFKTPWEVAWLLQVVARFAPSLNSAQRETIKRIAADEEEPHLCRVAALKVIALHGECDHALVRRMWNTAPACFRPDLVTAAYYARDHEAWCAAFLNGCKDDSVNTVVLKQLEQREARRSRK